MDTQLVEQGYTSNVHFLTLFVCLAAWVTDVELQLVGGPQREAGRMHRRAQAEARMSDHS
jgi:hypothetical protein